MATSKSNLGLLRPHRSRPMHGRSIRSAAFPKSAVRGRSCLCWAPPLPFRRFPAGHMASPAKKLGTAVAPLGTKTGLGQAILYRTVDRGLLGLKTANSRNSHFVLSSGPMVRKGLAPVVRREDRNNIFRNPIVFRSIRCRPAAFFAVNGCAQSGVRRSAHDRDLASFAIGALFALCEQEICLVAGPCQPPCPRPSDVKSCWPHSCRCAISSFVVESFM